MPGMGTDRPNVIFIQSDQHSAFVAGCYGDEVVDTPNLDALSSRGITFDAAYCSSPICTPSRASLMTGRMPFENRVWTNSHILDSAIPTFAHAMGAAGYRPVQIGRMHFNGPDQLHGFAERYVGDHSPNYPGGSPVDHGSLEGTAGPQRVSLEKSGWGQSAYEVHDEVVTATTVDYLERHALSIKSGQAPDPFCLAVGLMLPHQPFVARRADYEKYQERVPLPDHPEDVTDDTHGYLKWWRNNNNTVEVTEEEVIRCRTAYWALVDSMDRMIGKIVDVLERNGLLDNTLIVYTTDHGEQVGEHGLWWKQTFYEEAARVPVIISWPDRLAQGERCERVVSQIDLNATMLDLIGAPPLPGSSGRSMVDLIEDPENAEWNDTVFSEYCTEKGDPWHSDGDHTWQNRMVRQGNWKLNYYVGFEPQLFNLEDDPTEMNDLSRSPEHTAVKEELLALVLDGWDPEAIKAGIDSKSADIDLLKEWGANIQPTDSHRWDLRPEMDHVDGG